MKQLLITIAAVVLVGCSDPEAEANKLFTEASRLVKDADAITEPYSWKAFNKRKEALELIEKITVQYPQSSLSVQISQGVFFIQGQLINQVREKMKPDISIHDAVAKGNIEVVKQHLEVGADINAKDEDSYSPLHLAALEGHKEIAKLLVDKGTEVNAKGFFGKTPLHYAANQGFKEITELLIDNGVNVNAEDGEERTSLHYAAWEGHKEIVELLIAAGADVNAKYEYSGTPLDLAIKFNNSETADLLRKHGGKTGEELKAVGY